jgi:hypothetical protein
LASLNFTGAALADAHAVDLSSGWPGRAEMEDARVTRASTRAECRSRQGRAAVVREHDPGALRDIGRGDRAIATAVDHALDT